MTRKLKRTLPVLIPMLLLGILISMRTQVNAALQPLPDDCEDLPDDGKGLSACKHQQEKGHDDDHHTDDYEPTHDLEALAAVPCVSGSAGGYPCNNVDLLAFMPLANIGGGQGNDIWGWTDPQTGKEYALMGRTSGSSFVDISDPENPIYLGNLPTHTSNSTWRDIKVYNNHAFIVSEASGHGMQVFDLTRLRTVTSPPVTFSESAHYPNFGNAHNIAINEASGYAYAIGSNTCSGGLHMVNIQNPTSPTSAGCYSGDGYTHDTQCVIYNGPDTQHQGKEICFSSNEDTLTIVDVTTKSAPIMLSRTGYAGSGYTHQGWLTENHRYFLLDDELDEQQNGHNTRTYIWDVANLDSPTLIGNYTGPTPAIDHNLYIKGNFAYEANYRAGLRILDITNIGSGSLVEAGYFDIYPSSNTANFNGAWSNYPFFNSGVVIVSGIEQGLFVLQPNLGPQPPTPTPTNTPVPPTPTNTPTPPPSGDVFFDNFETNLGWTVNPNGSDTATTGQWERGDPQSTNSSGPKQLGNTVSGLNDLVTGGLAGSSAGSYDIDGGVTSIRSPNVALPASGNITLSFSYYLAHGSNSSTADYLRVSVVGGTTQLVFEELGANNDDDAAWATFNTSLNSFAGQTVYLLVQAADSGGASLVEAALDDVRITADTTPPPPTSTPTPTPPPGACVTYTSSDVPKNLPNGTTTISSNLSISGAGTIGDLEVSLNMDHAWVGDLSMVLRHQDTGTAVTILDRPGVPNSTYGCSGDDILATLDDEAAAPVENQCAGSVPTINGTFRPNNLLSAFDGQSGNGAWVLEVTDHYPSADAGVLLGWSIEICSP
ncbi:MAG: choice-of-anchor B family protein [Chloroflexi bacterium]|nr:choice-of-anchor B family protein [Chloroflexota bacterium]MCI0574624.1 choice-of-anchor B family protein [Chloroflexota bacterium]MCI0644024.1 choice-of-anchor B family protein [Chloroflexota bacterium]MCI0731698.1 choice-of-anchor B family protein [Chloroflexota bacterium]